MQGEQEKVVRGVESYTRSLWFLDKVDLSSGSHLQEAMPQLGLGEEQDVVGGCGRQSCRNP